MQIKARPVDRMISIPSMEWVAWDDSLGEDTSPYGYGSTEQEAVSELIEKLAAPRRRVSIVEHVMFGSAR